MAAALLAAPATASTWYTDHGDNQRTGVNPDETAFRALSKAWSVTLDGKVYASPIVIAGTVIVATENNTLYSFYASNGALRWRVHLRQPAPTTALACPGNISPSGITGTPAFDPSTNRILAVTNTVDAQNHAYHEIWSVSATYGTAGFNHRIAVPGQAENAEQQRGALAVWNGNVYVPFGGIAGDCGQYKGAVLTIKTNGQAGYTSYVVPTARMGGIWASGGPVVLSDGSFLVAVGNGASTNTAQYDGSDSVTRVSPASVALDRFAPASWASDNANDADLGSMTPALTSLGLVLQAGKSGTGYVLRASHLGGIGGQLYSAPLCRGFGVSAVTGSTVYLPCDSGLARVDVASSGQFVLRWQSSAATTSPVVGGGALFAVNGSNLVAISGHTGGALGSIALGASTTRFTTPALAGNKVFVGTTSSIVAINVG